MGTRTYSLEEKAEALAFLDSSGLSVPKAAKELGINVHTLRQWHYGRREILEYVQQSVDKQVDEARDDFYLPDPGEEGKYEGPPVTFDMSQRAAHARGRTEKVPALTDAILGAESTKARIVGKAEKVVETLLDHVMEKVEDSNLDQLISAIDRLLERIEAMTYRPQVEQREDMLVERLLSGSDDPEKKERVEKAVIEALRRRGRLSDSITS